MSRRLTLYSRRGCCLCDEMKAVIDAVARRAALEIEVIDVDQSTELREQFGSQVPVLFVDGRKAFKHRLTRKELEKYLAKGDRRWRSRLRLGTGGG